ncbi:hypothetical protein GALMADRAFT_64390 [Galerina marginata CBS 339.88]|uniref:Mucoidy inhibitor A n=1 Tax=Galerina marginata (strain CBS 339.88) TaxID=685588 RepID=A0A067T8C2_GALM3|nr:hypothetical protein GALMADRAFT_64390 [Galerina marginata CBS 339.88]
MASIFTIQASNHAIKSVTVFKSLKAEVVRSFTVNLKSGRNKFRIKGLPSSIDAQSVRFSVIGNGLVVDVGCTVETNSAQTYASDDPSEVIRALFTEKAELEREEVIRRQESQLLLKYTQTLSGEHGNATQIAAFLKSYADLAFKPFHAVAQIKEKIRQIDRQIEALQEKAASKRGTTLGQVYIVVFADTECCVELKLTYFVSNVQWKSNYGLHVNTDNGQASTSGSLHYLGTVTQATGEDWNDISLLLSTASDDVVKCIPQLRSIKLTSPKLETHATTIPEPATVFLESPVVVAFMIQGKSTIPSDGVDHQVSVAVLPLEAKISYLCIPGIEPKVFLQCKVKNTAVYQLLAGPVTVTLDDHYVSKTSINNINPGDSFECTLDDDTSTRVTYSRSKKTIRSDGGAFSEVSNTTTYTAKISIHNKHKFDITDLIVREVIPTSDDEHVKIVLRKPVGLSDAKQGAVVDLNDDGLMVGWGLVVDFGKGGRKEGRFEWKGKVRSGAQVNLEAQWEVTVPGETPWVELKTLSSVPQEADWKIARTKLEVREFSSPLY